MSTVAAIIEREIALVKRFAAVLNEEQEALKLGRIADLPDVNQAKSDLVQALNALEFERLAAIGSHDSQAGDGAMSRWIAQHPTDQASMLAWKALLGLAREAKAIHDLNARLVDMHLKQTSELLGALVKQGDKPALYSAAGVTQVNSGSRIVDSA